MGSIQITATAATKCLKVDMGYLSGRIEIDDVSPHHRLSRITMPKGRVSTMCFGGSDFVRGGIALIPAGKRVRRISSGGYARYISITFNQDWLETVGSFHYDWKLENSNFKHCTNINSTALERTLQLLAVEVQNPGLASDILIEAFGVEAIVALCRYFAIQHQNINPRAGGLSPHLIRKITELVENSLGRQIHVDQISKIYGMSAGHFRRSFKQSIGKTFHTYVEEVRLKHAKRLLIETEMPIHLISQIIGFNSSASFTKSFKRAIGESPQLYRLRK